MTPRVTPNANNLDSGTFKVKPLGIYRHPLDTGHNPANAKHLDGVIRSQPQPYGHRHHPVHHPGARRDLAPHCASDPANAVDEYPSAQVEGNPAALQPGPRPGIPRDHAGLPRGRGQPHRLFGSACGADAHLIRFVPGLGTDLVQQAGRLNWLVGEDLYFCALLYNLRRGAAKLGFPVAGFSRIRPSNSSHTDSSVRHHLGPTKNDHVPFNGPSSARQPDHDVVDDAAADRLLLFDLSQWTGPVLDSVQPNRYRNTIFYNRVDSFVPAFPQGGTDRRAGSGSTGRGRGARGDCRTWKCA